MDGSRIANACMGRVRDSSSRVKYSQVLLSSSVRTAAQQKHRFDEGLRWSIHIIRPSTRLFNLQVASSQKNGGLEISLRELEAPPQAFDQPSTQQAP